MNKYKQKILKFIYNLIEDHFIAQVDTDMQCPNCKEWFSISGINHKHDYHEIENGCSVKCGQCGFESRWDLMTYPFPVRINDGAIHE